MKYRCIAVFFYLASAHISLPTSNVSGFKNLPCMSAKIINTLLMKYKRTLSVSYNANSRDSKTITDILEDTFLCLNITVPILILNGDEIERRTRFLNYIIGSSWESVTDIVLRKKESFDHIGYYVISLIAKKVNYESLKSVFGILRKYSIVNVVVLYENIGAETEAWTYSPFVKEGRCNYIDLDYLGNFSKIPSKINMFKFFPKKTNNLKGCPLIVATWQNAPYMILQKNCTGHITMSGIEGNFLNYMASKRNFSLDVREFENDINPQGLVYANGTATKALKWVQDLKVNVSVGSYALTSLKSKFFASTYTYMTEHNVFIVPVGRPISPFKAAFLPFTFELWLALGICFILAYLLMVIISFMDASVGVFVYGYHVRYPILNMWNVAFGGTLFHLPKRNFARFILMQWIILWFVLRTGYLAQLFKQQRSPSPEEQFTTLSELIGKNGYKAFSDFPNYNMFMEIFPEGNGQ